MTGVAVEIMGQRIVEKRRLEIVWGIKNPVRFLGQAKQRHSAPVIEFVANFEEELRFAGAGDGRARTTDMEICPRDQIWGIGHGSVAKVVIEHLHEYILVGLVRRDGALSIIVEDDNRK